MWWEEREKFEEQLVLRGQLPTSTIARRGAETGQQLRQERPKSFAGGNEKNLGGV
jgi:hypothetical protein